ncbi:hypothetical protein J7E50_25335, partial [Pedobacter sp. ISL-68]|uniref:hypothetical protein n=1 Tax=Pedobacter sp. ISL-68 TaxID=2819165 RepID=UPI001BE62A37
ARPLRSLGNAQSVGSWQWTVLSRYRYVAEVIIVFLENEGAGTFRLGKPYYHSKSSLMLRSGLFVLSGLFNAGL